MSQPSFANRVISGWNACRYAVLEPVYLRFARARYERFYTDLHEKPLVSVYIPTYNRAELLLQRAVPSVLAQTYSNFELVILGDHCTDDTEHLVSKIGDPRIRFYNLPDRGYRYPPTAENHWLAGPVVAANKALELIRGRWIARIDDDDIWTADHIERLLLFAQYGLYEFVSAQYIEERYGRQTIIDGVRARDPYYTKKTALPKDDSPKIGGTSTWLYRSYLRFFRYNINCWRKKWNRVNDVDLSVRIYQAGVRMGFLEEVLAYVLPRPGENTVGLEAYKQREQDKLAHFAFKG